MEKADHNTWTNRRPKKILGECFSEHLISLFFGKLPTNTPAQIKIEAIKISIMLEASPINGSS
jgi:hypothetical protein